MKLFLLLCLLLVTGTAFGQSVRVFDIDVSKYPNMKAKFLVFDENGNPVHNLTPADIELKENFVIREITSITCPSAPLDDKLSIAMSYDISGSMKLGYGNIAPIDLSKDLTKTMINLIDPLDWEMALQTSDHRAVLFQDFISDKNPLLAKLNAIAVLGGNDFNEQLNNNPNGISRVASTGKYRRTAVVNTDGIWDGISQTEIEECVNYCIANNIVVHSVFYTPGGLAANGIKQSLRAVSKGTGGQVYEEVITAEHVMPTAAEIVYLSRGGVPCEIEWIATPTCVEGSLNATIKILTNGAKNSYQYKVGNEIVAGIKFDPKEFRFKSPKEGVLMDGVAKATAVNADFEVTDITSTNPNFDITPKQFNLKAGQTINLTVTYMPPDTNYALTEFELLNNVCPIKYYSFAGSETSRVINTLTLIKPNGAEEFVVGSDTLITWTGVLPSDTVTIEYSTNNGENWLFITDTATGLKYNWHVPKTPSNECKARVIRKVRDSVRDPNIEMVLIPAGKFIIGNTGSYLGDNDEVPTHEVTLTNDFYMSKYEVMQIQYEMVKSRNPSFNRGDSLPVEQISWLDAVSFCNALSRKKGFREAYKIEGGNVELDINADGYRLPTEAEWEYACKAGTTSDLANGDLTYYFCQPLDPKLDEMGFYCGNSNNTTQKVGRKQANAYGLYDMHGNVWEWCWNYYGDYVAFPETNPLGLKYGIERILRGGGLGDSAQSCRSSFRYSFNADGNFKAWGFRVVRTKK